MAHEWFAPASTVAQVVTGAHLRRGECVAVVVPSPSWPVVLAPQHQAVPSVRVAQV